MTDPETTIDVISDVVCPWCYLGKRRLERALALLPDRRIRVRWRPFRLDPTIPPEGIARDTYLTRKFGSVAAVAAAHGRLTELGRAEGIDYRFEAIARSPSTIDAHRLIRWAAASDREDAMVERLFSAYFSDGLDIGEANVLVRLADDVGLSEADIARRLAGDGDRQEVIDEVENAYRIGVSGVPTYVIDGQYGVVGAQPGELLAQAIVQVAEPAAKTTGT